MPIKAIKPEQEYGVARKAYTKSVKALSAICQTMDCRKAEVAAQVLLSANDSESYHAELDALNCLGPEDLHHATNVIRGRAICHKRPSEVIKNGKVIFTELESKWSQLHIKRRYSDKYAQLDWVGDPLNRNHCKRAD